MKCKPPAPRECPKCKAPDGMEYFPDDWEGDPSEGSRLMHKLPAHWSCSCGHNERDEQIERDYDDNESAYMDREFIKKHYRD